MRFHCLVSILAIAACSGQIGDDDSPGPDGGPGFPLEHPRIFITANRDRLVADLASQQPGAMRFKAIADRYVAGEDVYGFQAWNVALLGQLTGDPAYCEAAVATIDREVKDAATAIDAGDAPVVAGDSYLGVGDRIGDLALTYDWCFDQVGDRRGAWLEYANQAVYNVWHHQDATWGKTKFEWSGWATEDPSDNYYYSFLRATMLLGLAGHDELAGVGDWLGEFHDDHVMKEVVPAFDVQLVGGGSREGTGYGVSMRGLFELYSLWQDSTGESIADKTAHTRASMLAFIHGTLPTLDRVAPTGDHSRDSTASLFDYHRDYLQELISLFPDDPVAPRAQALIDASSVPEMSSQFMYVYDFVHPPVASAPLDGLATVYHASGTGQLYARSGWDNHATWVNLIAGEYTQSHAHQDQGALMIYKDGWLAYDPNVESVSGLRQETEAHNLVRIVSGGATVKQLTGTKSKLVALHRGTGYVHAAADLTPAYGGSSAVQKVEREIVYLEPDVVVVYDRVTTKSGTQQVWQLAAPKSPTLNGTRATITTSAHALNVQRLAPTAATATVRSYTSDSDFKGGFRLDETIAGGDQRYLHVLWIDNAVGTVTGETDGVTVTINGVSTRVKFSRDAIGGSLTIGGTTTTLGSGVDVLAE